MTWAGRWHTSPGCFIPWERRNLRPSAEPEKASHGEPGRRLVSRNPSDPSCKKNTPCHEFYLNKTRVHRGRASKEYQQKTFPGTIAEEPVPEYFLWLSGFVWWWPHGVTRNKLVWKHDAWWAIGPPLNLHKTQTHTHRLKIYYLRQSYRWVSLCSWWVNQLTHASWTD